MSFTDPFSFTRHGQAWNNHEWLASVLLYAWSTLLGTESLIWWKSCTVIAVFLVLFSILRSICPFDPVAFAAVLLASATVAPFFDIRPHLLSLLALAITLRLAITPTRSRWLLPALFLVWANVHAGFFLGLIALALVLVVARVHGQAPPRALSLWLACAGACCVTPNGIEAWLYPLRYALDAHSPFLDIMEWQPIWVPGGTRAPLYDVAVPLFLVASAILFWRRATLDNPRVAYTTVALGFLTLALSLRSRRFIPFFGIGGSLAVVACFRAVFGARAEKAPTWQWLGHAVLPPILASGYGVFNVSHYPLSAPACLFFATELDTFPVEAMNVVDVNALRGRVFSYYNWAGYVTLRTGGSLQVFIDGRANTVFDEATYRRYEDVLTLSPGWSDVLDASGADFVLWPSDRVAHMMALRASKKWRPIYEDHVATLFARSDLSLPPLLPASESPWHSLASGWAALDKQDWTGAGEAFERALDAMPYLELACEGRAIAEANRAGLAQARPLFDRCWYLFPDPWRRQRLTDAFQAIAARGRASSTSGPGASGG